MSSTGQAVGGIVGAVVGFFTPLGPVYGAQIGMMVGGVLDPPRTEGPRLEDLTTQTSVYGAFIPRLYGTTAVTGNVLWIQGDKLIEHSVESDGKGGPVVTSFEYFATFAVGLCEGPIDGVRRIWVGGQLWYDAGSDDIATIIASNEKAELFTLYLGTDTQTADPLIQADKGVANVPAYRGLAYIVFDTLPLEKYSNSLMGAQVKVEIVKNGSLTTTLTEQASVAAPASPFYISIAGDYMACTGIGYSNINLFSLKNPTQPQLLASVVTDEYGARIACRDDGVFVISRFNWFYLYDATGTLLSTNHRSVACTGFLFNGNTLYVAFGSIYTLETWDIGNPSAPTLVSTLILPTMITSMAIDPQDSSVMYAIGGPISPDAYLLTLDISVRDYPVLGSSGTTYGSDAISTILVDNGYLYTTSISAGFTVYSTNGIAAPTYVSRLAYLDAIYEYSAMYGDYVLIKSQIAGAVVIDKSDPSAPVELYSDTTSPSTKALQFYEGYFYFKKDASNIGIYFLAANVITSGSATLGDVVEAECLTSNILTAGDLDVTELTDQVRGYRISSLAPLRGGIDQLRKAWPFDAIQHGYKILFKKRGGASVATITEGELDARAAGANPGVRISNVREMDLVMPQQLTVQYMDAAREYDVNVAEESR